MSEQKKMFILYIIINNNEFEETFYIFCSKGRYFYDRKNLQS